MTSIGAEAIRLIQHRDTGLYIVSHMHHNGRCDMRHNYPFTFEEEARNMYNEIHEEMKQKQRIVNPPQMKLITKII